jgi:hypothetical protein
MHRIAEKLRGEYASQIGHRCRCSSTELDDHGVILEYQLGNTSRRLDAMLTGHSPPAPRAPSSSWRNRAGY